MRGMFPMAVALAAVAAFAQDVVQLAPDQVKVVLKTIVSACFTSPSRDTASFPCIHIPPT